MSIKRMKTIPLHRRGWPKARGGFQVGKAFPEWNPPRLSAATDAYPSGGGDFPQEPPMTTRRLNKIMKIVELGQPYLNQPRAAARGYSLRRPGFFCPFRG
jgi:hypothetical protein